MATLAKWVKTVDKYVAELTDAARNGVVNAKKTAQKRKSLGIRRMMTNSDAEREIVDGINDLCTNGISARVSTAITKQKSPVHKPNFFGVIQPRGKTQVQVKANRVVQKASQALPLFCASCYPTRPKPPFRLACDRQGLDQGEQEADIYRAFLCSSLRTESKAWGLLEWQEAVRAAEVVGVPLGFFLGQVSCSPSRRRQHGWNFCAVREHGEANGDVELVFAVVFAHT